jgi:hypothetical protein
VGAREGIENAWREAAAMVERHGVTAPQHIAVEDFAWSIGVKVETIPLRGTIAQLVVPRWGQPKIYLSDLLIDMPGRRFTIAHELGHYVLKHPSASFAEMCDPLARNPSPEDEPWEVEANAFASALLMPDLLVRPACRGIGASLDPALRIAYEFGVSPRASAIRFTQLTDAPCAAVLSDRGAVRWAVHSATFPVAIQPGRPIDPRSLAWNYFNGGLLRSQLRPVPAAAWLKAPDDMPLMEHSIASYERGTVLTMLRAPAPSARDRGRAGCRSAAGAAGIDELPATAGR